jgi:hypothetical protein
MVQNHDLEFFRRQDTHGFIARSGHYSVGHLTSKPRNTVGAVLQVRRPAMIGNPEKHRPNSTKSPTSQVGSLEAVVWQDGTSSGKGTKVTRAG